VYKINVSAYHTAWGMKCATCSPVIDQFIRESSLKIIYLELEYSLQFHKWWK